MLILISCSVVFAEFGGLRILCQRFIKTDTDLEVGSCIFLHCRPFLGILLPFLIVTEQVLLFLLYHIFYVMLPGLF